MTSKWELVGRRKFALEEITMPADFDLCLFDELTAMRTFCAALTQKPLWMPKGRKVRLKLANDQR